MMELLHNFLEMPRWEESAMERAKQMFISHYRSLSKSLERATADRLLAAMLSPSRYPLRQQMRIGRHTPIWAWSVPVARPPARQQRSAATVVKRRGYERRRAIARAHKSSLTFSWVPSEGCEVCGAGGSRTSSRPRSRR